MTTRLVMVMAVVSGLAACGTVHQLDDANNGSGTGTDAGVAIDADTTAPDTMLDSTPAAATKETAAVFAFHSDDATATFRCAIDGGAPAACASPATFTVVEGAHTFAVKAIDPAGNEDKTGASFAWTVDTTPPDTTITAAPPALDNSTTVSLEFTSEPNATFECSDDGAAYAPCTTPHPMAGLADGAHTFDVRAIDAVGNVDPSPAHHAWVVDTSTPDTRIDSGPTGSVASATAVFAFSSPNAGPGATFACGLDGAALATCTSPVTYAALAEAAHVFTVRVTNAAGTSDPTPATRAWTVDLTAPVVTITSGPSGPTSVAAPTFTFTTGDATIVQCKVDGGALVACDATFTTATLADGPHTFEVVAADAAGNAASASRSFTVDTMSPTVTITGGPSGPTNDKTPTFTFTTAGAPTLVQCAIDGAGWTACSATYTSAALADGAHEFDVRATDAAGNVGTASRAFSLDTGAPTVTITGGPSGLTNDSTPTFTFTTAGAPTVTQCRIGGGAYAPCSGSFTPGAALADGAYTFDVQVSDAAGNSGTASRAFTVDATPPTVTITGGPSGLTNDPTPTFTFTTGGSPTTTQCRVDGAAWAACTASYTAAALADGAHTFDVQVIDAATNTATASRAFTVDATPPTVTITGGPTGLTNDPTPTFTFTTGGSPTTTQCRMDGGAWIACNATFTSAALADGAHAFDVQVIDAATNSATASRAFTLDATPPTVTIIGGPTGLTNDPTPTFTFTTGGAPTTTQCRLNGGAWAACSASFTPSAPLADGPYTFDVQVIDAAANSATASRAFTVDATPPTVTITGGPTGLTNLASPTFTFTTGGAPTTTQCRIGGGAYVACAASFTPSSPLADGSYSFDVQVIDAAGNSATASRAFTVDATPPTVAITGGPTGLTNDATPTFTFTTDGSPITVQCRFDAGPFAACMSPFTPAALADGAHTLDVQAIDAAGNTADATRGFTVDATPPTVTITGGPTGLTNVNTPTFTFTTGGSPTTTQCRIGGAYSPCTSTFTPSAPLADGSYSFDVQVIDAAGNSASASRTFTVDATPPTVTITGGPSGLTNLASPTFTFTTGGSPTTTQCRIGGGAFASCAGSFTPSAPLADGSYVFEVDVIDAAGNSANATRAFTVDATPPTVVITGGPTGLTNNNVPTFTFTTGGSPTTTQCRVSAAAWQACFATFTPPALADGSYTFEVQVIDAAGNSASASRAFTVDATPPTVTITGGPSGTTNNSSPTFTFTTGGSPTTVQCRFDSAAYVACSASFTPPSPLPDGAHEFDVQAIDAAGNQATATRSFTIDTRVTITGSVSPANAANLTASANGTPCANQACLVLPGTKVHLALAPATGWSFSGWTGAGVGCTGTALAIDVTAGTVSSSCTANFTALTVSLTAQPDPIAAPTSSHFAWTKSAAVTSVYCSLDGQPAGGCTGSTTEDYTYMGPGPHTFAVYGADAAGAKSATASYSWIQHVDDGHVVIMGHDFHNVVPPYTYGSGTAQSLLLSAIKLGRYSPITNNYEVLIFSKSSTALGTTEVANIKAAVAAGSGAVDFTDLTATDATSLTNALAGKSVFIVPDQTDHGAAALGAAWKKPLADFVTRGGVLIVLTGLDSAGAPDDTAVIASATGLIDFLGSSATNGGSNIIWPYQDSPVAFGLTGQYSLDGSVQFYSDGRLVVMAPFRLCTNGTCARANQVVAHKSIHTIEGFDYVHPSWPWSPWTAGTTNIALTRDTANAHDETTGATGGAGAGNVLDQVAWAWRSDVNPVPNSTLSEWVRFTDAGPSGASYAGVGIGGQPSGANAVVAWAYKGVVALEPGFENFGASPHFAPDLNVTDPSAAVTYGAWYQLRITNAGGYFTASLYDSAGTQVLTVQSKIAQPYTGGVAIGVSKGATIDSVTLADAPEGSSLFGTDTTSSANTSFATVCPDGEVAVGARGRAAEAIDDFAALHCARIVADSSHPSGYHLQAMSDSLGAGGGNPSGGGPWDQTCAGDGMLVAINGGVGTVNGYTSLYAIQLTCETFTLTGAPGTYTLVPGATATMAQIGTGHAGVPLTWTGFFPAGTTHAITGLDGYYGPWPIYAPFVVVNGVEVTADRPWVVY